MSVATWLRRRFPLPDEWHPRMIDRDRINRTAWVFAIAFFTLGTIWLVAPASVVAQLSGGRLAPQFYAYFVYDDTFRQTRLPLLVALMGAHIVLYMRLVADGRWRKLTRRIDIGISVAVCAVLLWSTQVGRILEHDAADRGARIIIVLIVLLVLVDVGSKLLREQARVHIPKSLRQ